MSSGHSEWQSPRDADPGVSPSRRRVQELKQKFEGAGSDQSGSPSKGSSYGSSKSHKQGSGHGSGPGKGSEPSQGSGPSGSGLPTSQEFSDSLELQETRPSFEDVLESTRIDEQPKKSRRPENVYPSRMDPEGFPEGFRYPDYARRPPKQQEEKTEDSTPQSQDDSYYKKWYFENMSKVTDYEILSLAVIYLLQEDMPDLHVDQYYPGNELADRLNEYVADLQSKFRKFDLDLREIQGFEISGRIQSHKNKVLDVVSELEKRLQDAKEEASNYRSQVADLDMELIKAHEIIEQFRIQQDQAAAKAFDLEELMMQFETRARHSLSESHNEELEKLRSENEKLHTQLSKCAREMVENEEQCMQDLVEAFDEHEINSMLKEALFEVLEDGGDKSLNKGIIERVVRQWLHKLISAIKNSKTLIEQTNDAYTNSKNKLADLQNEHQEHLEEMEKIQSKIAKIKRTIERHKEQKQQLQNEINELTNQVSQMEEHRNQLQSCVDSASPSGSSPHRQEISGAQHSSEGSKGTGKSETSEDAHSTGVSGGKQSTDPSERQRSSVSTSRSGSPHERPSPGKKTPMSGQTRQSRRLFRTESPDKRDSEEKTPRYKHYFPSQGPDYGSDFSFQYPSPGYFGFQDTPEQISEEESAKPPDPEAVIQPHMWFGSDKPFTPPRERDESLVDDVFYPGVGSPYDFRRMKNIMEFKKGMIYRHILPSFGSDDDPFVHPYRFRNLPSDRYFLSPDAANSAQSSGGMQGSGTSDRQQSSRSRSGSPREMPSPGRHTPKGGQTRHGRRLVRTDRVDNRGSFEITPPYRHYFPSQGPNYGSEFSFQYPSPEYFENQGGRQGRCSHDHTQTLTKTITISPDKEEPFQVQIEMKPQGIAESASGEHVVCDIAVNVQDVLKQALKLQEGLQRKKKTRKPPKQYVRGTPPITPSSQRDPEKGTPKSIFKQRYYGAKNLFGAKKDPYEYKKRRANTIEWEQKTPEFENSFDNTLLDDQFSPEDTSPNWNRQGGIDAPESQWNRPGEFGGASAPKEHSQTFPGTERHRNAPDQSTA